jgi:hypothetical protein
MAKFTAEAPGRERSIADAAPLCDEFRAGAQPASRDFWPAAREARAFPMAERDKSVMNLQSTSRDA